MTPRVRKARSQSPGSSKGLNPFPRLQPHPCLNIYPSHFVSKPGLSSSACCSRASPPFSSCPNRHSAGYPEPWLPRPSLQSTHRPLCSLPPTLGMFLLTFSTLPGRLLPLAPTPAEKNAFFLPGGSGKVPDALRLWPSYALTTSPGCQYLGPRPSLYQP